MAILLSSSWPVPSALLQVALWAGLGVVVCAVIWLLLVLVREWREGSLW